MCEGKFLDLINEIREASFDTLVKKNSGYATEDRLHNFREGAKVTGLTAAQTAWGYLTKHLIALRDKIERDDFNNRDDFKEKVQDSINYLCLIWAIGNDIEQDQTVDAVPMVRCRECKHWKPSRIKSGNSFSDMEYLGDCEFTNYYRSEIDF